MSAKDQERKRKAVFALESPYSIPQWPPEVDKTDQEIILKLLCNLLQPISFHRSAHSSLNRTRRLPLDLPDILSFLTIGLNDTTAHLQSTVAQNARYQGVAVVASQAPSLPIAIRPLAVVMVCKSDSQPSQLHSHLPLLCHLASTSYNPVKLVALPKGSDAKLAAAMGLPSAGCLGILKGAPGSEVLCESIGTKVSPVQVQWLPEIFKYQPTKVRASLATVGQSARAKGAEHKCVDHQES